MTNPFRVYPKQVEVEPVHLSESERKEFLPDNSGYVSASMFAGALMGGELGHLSGATLQGALAGGFIGWLGAWLWADRVNEKRVRKQEHFLTEKRRQSLQSLAESEAARTQATAQHFFSTGEVAPRTIRDSLERVENLLKHANSEFEAHAFSPFWDAVEEAARELSKIECVLRDTIGAATAYSQVLDNKSHSFPEFPVAKDRLPNPSPAIAVFHRTVRRGQTDFQFANIWEHRRTRHSIVAGFNNLGDAVAGLAHTIETAFEDLGSLLVVQHDAAMVAQRSLYDLMDERSAEQSRMLDNLQTGSAPEVRDRPPLR